MVQAWVRWNGEIFANLSAVLLGGPAVVGSLLDVVGRGPRTVVSYNPRGPHPTPWFRVFPVHLAAIEAWLATSARPPVNLRLILDGEEEIGSPTLVAALAADVALLSDTRVFAPEAPALITGLRGALGAASMFRSRGGTCTWAVQGGRRRTRRPCGVHGA